MERDGHQKKDDGNTAEKIAAAEVNPAKRAVRRRQVKSGDVPPVLTE
jgi:hypothetical protein